MKKLYDTTDTIKCFIEEDIKPWLDTEIKRKMSESHEEGFYDGCYFVTNKIIDILENNNPSKEALIITLKNVIADIKDQQNKVKESTNDSCD